MKVLTTLPVNFTDTVLFKSDYSNKDYKYFKLVSYIGWAQGKGRKHQLYTAICKNCKSNVIIPMDNAKNNAVLNCGCYKWNKLTSEERIEQKPTNAAFTKLYGGYKRKCKIQDLKFELNLIEFFNITQKNCYYCNRKPYQKYKTDEREFVYNGLDRIDSKKGYEKENIVSCCGKCNMMKWNLKQDDFINHAKLIADNFK